MKLSISNSFIDLHRLDIYYNQALYPLKSEDFNEKCDNIIYFYDFALNFIIESRFTEDILYACHPDIIQLWKHDEQNHNSDKIETLYTYLINERSITKTSQLLFLHRNTLIYRIKKIEEQLNCDINDHYTREYIIFSIKVLKLYKNKYKNYLSN